MNRLQELRIETGLSQPAMAAKIGIPHPTYQRYEHDGCVPYMDKIRLIAEGFGVSADYILGMTDVKRPEYSVDELMMLKKYRELTTEKKIDAQSHLDFLLFSQNEEKKKEASAS